MGRLLRIIGILVGALILVVVIGIGAIYVNGRSKINARFNNPVSDVRVVSSPEAIERGRILVNAVPGCAACHSSDPAAANPVLDGAPLGVGPLGTFHAANLTPGGKIREYSDGELIRAIREGIARDGRPLLVMPSEEYRHLSDIDVQAIVAYLRSQPSNPKPTPANEPTFLTFMLLGAGQVNLSNQQPTGNVIKPQSGRTAERGTYLISLSCTGCHGAKLDGTGIPPGAPAGPSVAAAARGWTEAQFITAIRTGKRPDGSTMNDEMPWKQYRAASDDDLAAIHAGMKAAFP